MKVRNGFVSNSSSCSFVVRVREYAIFLKLEGKPVKQTKGMVQVLPKEKEEILLEYGFAYSKTHLPAGVMFYGGYTAQSNAWKTKKKSMILAFTDICNADIVISFLIKNKIPFEGLDHYGHESLFYDPKNEYVKCIPNSGLAHGTYRSSRSGRKVPISDWK